MNRVPRSSDSSDEEMAELREALLHERPIVLKVIERFGAEMYRKGVMETLRQQNVEEKAARQVQKNIAGEP